VGFEGFGFVFQRFVALELRLDARCLGSKGLPRCVAYGSPKRVRPAGPRNKNTQQSLTSGDSAHESCEFWNAYHRLCHFLKIEEVLQRYPKRIGCTTCLRERTFQSDNTNEQRRNHSPLLEDSEAAT
jgi:hypothetical protein